MRLRPRGGCVDGRWFDVYAFRLGGPESRKVAILFDDITDRRKPTRPLRESEGRLQLAVGIAQMGTFEIDLATDAVTVNEPGGPSTAGPTSTPRSAGCRITSTRTTGTR
ncbi:MAG: hypothetical protein WKF75_10290 [Singulisphaera sp.]